MKKLRTLWFIILFVQIQVGFAQQVSTDNTQEPNELIQNLVGSDCITVNNVSSPINGDINNIVSYGSFNNNSSNFPLQSGLILSTGRVSSAGNIPNSNNLSEGDISWGTDSDILEVIGIDQTLNATSIEFDFSSPNSSIAFNYLFASEEYQQEFPCNFKDVFAILIKRAGTSDPYVNIAVIPETSTEISSNTIRPNISGFCDALNEEYFRGYNSGDTNFSGSTQVLTARTDIIANETYHIKFVIADHFDERFDSAVFIEADGFGTSINLGPDQTICGRDLTLDANVSNSAANYSWYLNGNLIPGEINPSIDVEDSGTYSVEVLIPTSSGNCILEDSINIEITPYQDAALINNWEVCDPEPSDGLFDFDFSLKNEEIYANLPSTDYTISYHNSLDDAQNNENRITGIYQNTESIETFFVRIESLAGDCLQIGTFDILVKESPNTLEYTIDVCNGELVEPSFYDLNLFIYTVSNFELDNNVTFYLTEEDAINTENAITEFPNIDDELPFFYARVEDIYNFCPSVVRVNLNYITPPDIGERYIINLCMDPDYNESIDGETYDYNSLPILYNLEDMISEIETIYPDIFVQIEMLVMGIPRTITTASPTQIVPISIRTNGENCPTFLRVEFHKNLLFNRFKKELNLFKCDDETNDGVVNYNLAEVAAELKGTYDINLQFYESEEDRLNDTNPLDENIPLTVIGSKTIYLSSAYKDCSLNSKLNLGITPGLYVPAKTIDYCGNTNPLTNTTNIVLDPLVETVVDGLNIVSQVEFYLTEEDAENQVNQLVESVDIVGNQQTLFIRVIDIFSTCHDVSTLQVNITNAIGASNPDPLIICDDDQDGFSNVNLENILPELSGGMNNINFTFFEDYEDAVENEFPIINRTDYNTESTTVFIRSEIEGLDCFSIFSYDIQIYANPFLNEISDFIKCELDLSTPSEFLFINKDTEIINGQEDMQVLYFETEANAINRVNPIDKNTAYLQSSNPQTIYVRLENETGNSCFKVAPMNIESRQAPIFNEPSDVFECDINKTGLATTDLNNKIQEINLGSPTSLIVTFHLSPLNAELGTNEIPLNFTATSNPQLIYARIENINSGCHDTASFWMNTLSLPEVNFDQKLEACGNNYNLSPEWDLTQIELDILDGRQYNIAFTYYESEDDAIANQNRIQSPENYINSEGSQTIYAKIRNATTECYDIVPFELIVNSPPPINEFEIYEICENSENFVDLKEINTILLDNTYNVLLNYFTSEVDAENNQNPLNTDYFYTDTTETLFARVEYSTTNCYAVYPFNIIVKPLPIANTPSDLQACDDDFDGMFEFNLNQQTTQILGDQNSNEFLVTYHQTEDDAIENMEALNENYLAYDGQVIYIRLENIQTGCFDTTQFSVIIHELPFASITDQVICLNDLPLMVSAYTNVNTDTYLWSTNATTPEIQIDEIGTYTVTITNQFGCQNTSTFNVIESESANIDVVETVDFSDPNNITITISGIGNYLYILDDGVPQDSNVFENVALGYHTITIIDLNGCAEVTKEVLVIDAPKFFTPNGDTQNDTWHIIGIETLPGSIVYIFDRYGKLLKQLGHNSRGWNGTYNGHHMPPNDYWFLAEVKQESIAFEVRGHFTLRR